MKKCPYCAEEIQDEAVVCKHCGRDLVEQPQAPPQQVQVVSPKKKTGCIAAGCAIAFVAFIVLIAGNTLFCPTGTTPPAAEKVDPKVREQRRQKRVEAGVTAAVRLTSAPRAQRCKDGSQIKSTWENLRLARPTDQNWDEALTAVEKLEGCRGLFIAEHRRAIGPARVALRKAWAKQLETNYLDKRINATVTTSGGRSDRLTIKWALVSKVTAHEVSKGDMLTEAQNLGFKRVTLTDGFNDTFYWDLKPEGDAIIAERHLAKEGLHQPFRMATRPASPAPQKPRR